MIKNITFLSILLLVSICCQAQESGLSKAELAQLFEQEKRNEERAKYGTETSIVLVVSNPEKVKKLRQYIHKKNRLQKIKELAELKNRSLAERYKAGDESVVSEIIQTLKGDDEKARKNIYFDLSKKYDDPDSYMIKEEELINAIFKNLSLTTDESAVIQLAGYMKLAGYVKRFEDYLLSNKAQDVNRLLYWLGSDGKSKKALAYAEELIFSSAFDFENYDYAMSALEGFSKNGDAATQQKVFEICLKIYDKKLIPKAQFEEMKDMWSSTNPAISLTDILLNATDKRVISIANDLIKSGIRQQEAVAALVRLEGAKHQSLVYKLLKNEDTFYDGLYPAVELYVQTKDEDVLKTILVEFEKLQATESHQIDRIVTTLIEANATHYFDKLDSVLRKKKLIRSMKESYALTKETYESIAKDLYEMGVVQTPIAASIIEKAKELADEDTRVDMYALLTASNIFHWFDAETGFVPVDYDNLIKELAKRSNGKFPDFGVWMDAELDQNYNVSSQVVYVAANAKIYAIQPEDIGDWYDVELTIKLLNTILADTNIVERYNFIETGDQTAQIMFGPSANVAKFVEKYNLK
ncbi:MAG: hypothetical protein AAF617_12735 [Bacteroidota bacterium]